MATTSGRLRPSDRGNLCDPWLCLTVAGRDLNRAWLFSPFDNDAACVGVFYDLAGLAHIFFIRQGGTVKHNGGESAVDTLFANFKRVAVVQMQGNGKVGDFQCGFDEFYQIFVIGIRACTFGNLENQRHINFFNCFYDSLNNLHIVHIKCTNGIAAFVCFFEHFC